MPARSKGIKPVRDVGKRIKRGRKAYIVPTERNPHGFVAGESFLERNHLLLLSLQAGLTRVSDQSVCIDLDNEILVASKDDLPERNGKKAASYTADSEYQHADGHVGVCESKPSVFVEKYAEKHALAEKVLGKYGKRFTTLTEESFTPAFVSNLENLKKALSPGQQRHAELAGQKIAPAIEHQERWLTQDLKRVGGLCNADIFFGLAYGVLRANLSEFLFSDTAFVEAAHGTLDHLLFLEL